MRKIRLFEEMWHDLWRHEVKVASQGGMTRLLFRSDASSARTSPTRRPLSRAPWGWSGKGSSRGTSARISGSGFDEPLNFGRSKGRLSHSSPCFIRLRHHYAACIRRPTVSHFPEEAKKVEAPLGKPTVYNRTPSFPCSAAISPLTAEENGKIRSMRCLLEETMLC